MFKINPKYNETTGKYIMSFEGMRSKEDSEQYKRFTNIYDIETLDFMSSNQNNLIPKKNRDCRFCGRKHPETTFRNKAHIVPQLIGRSNYLSDFECDKCNHIFSDYENNFSNFLGLSRTISGKKGTDGIPKFKTPDKNLMVKEVKSDDDIFTFRYSEIEKNKNISHDKERKEIIFNYSKHSFIPIKVYKCLLKIAISLIKVDIEHYKKTIMFLMTNELDENVQNNPLISLFTYFIPGTSFPTPYIFSCVKKDKKQDLNYPSRTIVISFHNRVFQIFVPFDSKDSFTFDSKEKVNLNIMPPFIDKDWLIKYGKPIPQDFNLTNREKVKSQKEKVVFKYIK